MLRTLTLLTTLWLAGIASSVWGSPPNILLLMAEDLSPRIGSYGDRVATTPHLDALAQQGLRFTRAFTTAGVCAPSRAAMITGMHQISFGAQHMRTSTSPLGPYFAQPAAQVRAFPELLRAQGYFTYTDQKLDYQFSGIRAGSGPFTLWDRQGAEDTAWRERAAGQPFFALINFMETHESGVMQAQGEPHSPSHAATQQMRSQFGLIAPSHTDPEQVLLPPYYPDSAASRGDIARHYDNIRMMDRRVGRILQALEADGLAENTVVIWTTDHGDGLPRAKRELYDSGIHVPMLMRLPAKYDPEASQRGSVDDRLISFVDLAPTILSLAGVQPPEYLHGINYLRQQRGHIFAARDRIDEVPDRQRAVRDRRYKYIRSWYPELPGGHALTYRDNLDMVRDWRARFARGELTAEQRRWFEPNGTEQLYDTVSDPHELQNLAGQPSTAAVQQQLSLVLDQFLARIGDTAAMDEREMRAELLQDGEIPITPAPQLDAKSEQLTITSPIGASIGYRLNDNPHWQLYQSPLSELPSGTWVHAKSVRYGWRESIVVSHYFP